MSNNDLISQFKLLLAENNIELRKTIREEIKFEIVNVKVDITKLVNEVKNISIVVSKLEKNQEYMEISIKDLQKRIENWERNLSAQIKASQKDTIETLTAVIQSGYELNERRFARLEKHAGLPPIDPK